MGMPDKVWFCGLIWVILPFSIVVGQPEQGQTEQALQYEVGLRLERRWQLRAMGRNVDLSTVAPPGVRLPALKEGKPLFGTWPGHRSRWGSRWFLLARSGTDKPYDCLYIDTDGDGHLDDEQQITGNVRRSRSDTVVRFDPVAVRSDGPDGPLTYHLAVQASFMQDRIICHISPACRYVGQVHIGQMDLRCDVLDLDGDGIFAGRSDRIILEDDQGNGLYIPTGKLVDVNGAPYWIDVTPDGRRLRWQRADDEAVGFLRVPEALASVTLADSDSAFRLRPRHKAYVLEPGTYRVVHWSMNRKDRRGDTWTAAGSSPRPERSAIVITAETELTLDGIGEPLVSRVTVKGLLGQYQIGHELLGPMGEQVTLEVNGRRPPPPKVRILDSGRYDRTLSFAYGLSGTCTLSWREPAKIRRPVVFTAQVAGPFKVRSQPYVLKFVNRYLPHTGQQVLPARAIVYAGPQECNAAALIDGQGLMQRDQDELIEHDTDPNHMFLLSSGLKATQIELEFVEPVELDLMLVWNYNEVDRTDLGLRQADIQIWGQDSGWQLVARGVSFGRAEGTDDYDEPTVVRLNGLKASRVRFDRIAGFSRSGRIGLSEVQFFQPRPTKAIKPRPADGGHMWVGQDILRWTPPAGVKGQQLFLGFDPNQMQPLADLEPNHCLVQLAGLANGSRYYWRIDSIMPEGTVLTGDTWSFSVGGLAGWWRFDEASGQVAKDSSGNG
ncbi:MAG: hypothetical protein QHH07_12645, partial [Sedimentisphaerales bacterium]|nr:hypothetical protein [Sedimentisphaerales bacterium]